jgi:hypothetical protein
MSAASDPVLAQPEGFGKRLRQIAVGALFALVLLIPKILHMRRNSRSWLLFRIFLGLVGMALVVLPLGLGNGYLFSVAGLAMFIAAILLPPAKPETSADDKSHELGALVVVNGGRFKPEDAASFAAQLFVGADQISVLNSNFQSFLEIPVSKISAACVEESGESWRLRVTWSSRTAEFSYRGVFAEHLARVAESTIRSVMRPALPVLPQHRAAGA